MQAVAHALDRPRGIPFRRLARGTLSPAPPWTSSPESPELATVPIHGRLSGWAHDRLFQAVHRHRLVYNACWEDPRLDRALLGLGPDSRVVMITSAGCNALDYLLDDPAEIHAVDVNPRQNAVLELKQGLIRQGLFVDLFRLFGEGRHPGIGTVLDHLRPDLSPGTAGFWAAKRHYLDGSDRRESFYFHGSSGDVAWWMRRLVLQRRPALWSHLSDLLECRSLDEQAAVYNRLEPLLWGAFARWLVRQPLTLSLLGVPRPQARLIADEHPGGVSQFICDKVRHVATRIPMAENYFWRVYVKGAYTPECCPNYLKAQHFPALRARVDRVRLHTRLLTDFLARHPAPYTHYVLLDHQDWMAAHQPSALAEEWRRILHNSRPGTRILFRSASPRVGYLPGFARNRLRFDSARTALLHAGDRVGTYGSLHLAEVI